MFDRLAEPNEGWLFSALARRWWVLALVAVVFGLGGYVISAQQTKKYTAKSALLFFESQLDQELVGKASISTSDPARQAATNQALVELPTVARMTAAQLHIPVSRVVGEIAFGSDSTSDVLSFTVTDQSPSMAARIANTYGQQYIQFMKGAATSQLTTAENLVDSKLAAIPVDQQNGPVASQLHAEKNTLDLLKSAQTGNAQVVQTATIPSSPSSPTPVKDGMLGLIVGLFVGLGAAAALERRDRRIKSPDEVEALYGAPVVGMIPESASLRSGHPTPRDEEAFLMLRAQLRYFDVDRTVKRVMITSADAGEGKTLVSFNLARAAAGTDERRILLIEADMRRPRMSRLIGREPVAGLAELLSHPQNVESGLRELVLRPDQAADVDRPAGLDVLVAGSIPPNPIELLESERMLELLEYADGIYETVIIDTPPIGVVSDGIPLLHHVDGLVAVTRLGTSRRDRAQQFTKRLRGLNANVLGVVINSYHPESAGHYYYYGEDRAPGRNNALRRPRADQGARTGR